VYAQGQGIERLVRPPNSLPQEFRRHNPFHVAGQGRKDQKFFARKGEHALIDRCVIAVVLYAKMAIVVNVLV
jgi:hypothetical protein